MKFSTLSLPVIVAAQDSSFAGYLNTTSSAIATDVDPNAATITATRTTLETVTSCKGGCTKGEPPSTYLDEVTYTTTYCPDTVTTATPAPTEGSTVTEVCTTVETITSCKGGCTKGETPSTYTEEYTYTTTYCPESTTAVPPEVTTSCETTAPTYTTETLIKTITSCPGGCTKGASTITSIYTELTTYCPESETTQPPPVTVTTSPSAVSTEVPPPPPASSKVTSSSEKAVTTPAGPPTATPTEVITPSTTPIETANGAQLNSLGMGAAFAVVAMLL